MQQPWFLLATVLGTFLSLGVQPASAAPLFVGPYYDVANWTTTISTFPTESYPPDLSAAPTSITFTSGTQGDDPGETRFTIAAQRSSLILFSWSWTPGQPVFRDQGEAGFIRNGSKTLLTQRGVAETDTAAFAVAAGDIFGFYIQNDRGLDGFLGEFTVRDASVEATLVPEPGTLLLFSFGLVLLVLVQTVAARHHTGRPSSSPAASQP